MGFIVLPISRDPAVAVTASYEVMQTYYPGWQPDPSGADPMTALLNAAAVLYTDLGTLATSMGSEAFRYEGRTLDQLPPIDAKPAHGTVTFTATDSTGWDIDGGTEIAGIGPSGDPVTFVTTDLASIPAASTTVAGVPVIAVIDGRDGNAVSGTGDFVQYLDFLLSVTFDAPTLGGQDAETDDAYLDRLVEEKQLSSPEPIRPNDWAVLARALAGVGVRATAIDMLDPGDGSTNNLATVTVALADAVTGTAVDSGIKAAVQAGLDAEREEGWQNFVIDPTVSIVDVEAHVIARPGWDLADVAAQTTAAIANYLDPAIWGLSDTTGQTLTWENQTIVRIYALVQRLMSVDAVAYVVPGSLKIALHGGSRAATDLTLPGFAPLPTITGATIVVSATAS